MRNRPQFRPGVCQSSAASALALGAAALIAALTLGPPAAAQECLLDASNDGNADTNVDTTGGANASGAFSIACGAFSVASGLSSTATGAFSVA